MCIFRIKILYIYIYINSHHCGVFHCVKSVRIRSYSGPHFPEFGLKNAGKMRSRTTPNTDNFCVVFNVNFGLIDHNILHTNAMLLELTCWVISNLIKITTQKLWIWSHLLKKSFMENYIVWVVWSIYLCIVINLL